MAEDEQRSLERRLTEVESHLAHLQHFTDQLNQVVTEQASEILLLRRTISRLNDQVKELREKPQSGEPSDLFDEKPPHY